MADFLQQLTNGLSLGATYALIAVGFSMVYGILGLVNFAHGDCVMASCFLGIILYTSFQLPLAIAMLVAIAAGALIAVLVEVLTYHPVRNAPRLNAMMTTFGAALIIRSVIQATAGSSTRPFSTPLSGRASYLGPVWVPWISVITVVVTCVVVAAFGGYLKYRKSGYGIRAAAQDIDTAALMGVPIHGTVIAMYAFSGALGALGGLLYTAQVQAIYPSFGFAILMKGFVAAILGGIGNLKGALVGGLALGVVESIAGPYLTTAYLDAIAFGVLIVVLLVRPNGLLGARVQERV